MPQCLVVGTGGVLEASAADPCTTLVALSPVEYAAISANPFQLSPEDGATLGFLVAGVWAVAWGFRVLGDYLQSRSATDE